jgi:cobalt-zinc-cadmium efflux system outer membrane protein
MLIFEIRMVFAAFLCAAICGCAQTRSNRVTVFANKPEAVASVPSNLGAGRIPDSEEADAEPGQAKIRLTSENSVVEQVELGRQTQAVAVDSNATSSHGTLTLADLEAIALQNNPTLSQAAAAVDQQRGVYRQSGLYPNPQLGYLNSTANQSAPKQSNGVFFSQEIVTAKKLSLSQQSASQEIKRLQWDQAAQRVRVLNDLKIRYYEVLGSQKAVEAAERLEGLAQESLSIAQKLFEAKAVSRPDVLQAKVLLETSRINRAEANHRYEAGWEQLTTMLGTPSMGASPLVGELEGDIPVLDQESCWQRLLAESPQLRASESELDHGRAELRSSQAQAIPNFTLQTVTDYDRVTQSTTVSTLVAMPIPFYNRNQGNIDKAAADIRADQSEICRVQLVLRDQLAESFRRYKTSRVQAERLGQFILPDAEENLKLTQRAFEGGEIAFRDVLIAQQTNAQSRMAYIEALTELRKVVTEIDGLQLTGGLNPAAIGSAIQSQPGGSTQRQRALLNEVQDRASKQLLPAAQIGQ